jgi:hypothetical protein
LVLSEEVARKPLMSVAAARRMGPPTAAGKARFHRAGDKRAEQCDWQPANILVSLTRVPPGSGVKLH